MFGYSAPSLCTVAIDMHPGIQPASIIQGTCFDECKFRHHCDVTHDWGTALRAKVAVNRLAAITSVAEFFELPLD